MPNCRLRINEADTTFLSSFQELVNVYFECILEGVLEVEEGAMRASGPMKLAKITEKTPKDTLTPQTT